MEKDAGFCSGSSENGDDYRMENSRDSPRSLTDASDDSVEVKFTPITIPKNKRKCSEPSKVICESTYPLKKRMKFEEKFRIKSEPVEEKKVNLFRPWASVTEKDVKPIPPTMPDPAQVLLRHPGVTTLHRPYYAYDQVQDEPLALVAKKPCATEPTNFEKSSPKQKLHSANVSMSKCLQMSPLSRPPSVQSNSSSMSSVHSFGSTETNTSPVQESESVPSSSSGSRPSQQRNYKNMTRERRIEANARERTRVHTISAAFETLRKAIPSYSDTQKLSKLSVLRVACSYILTLGRIVGEDYSADQSAPSISDCVDEMAKIIESDGKIRKKKDE